MAFRIVLIVSLAVYRLLAVDCCILIHVAWSMLTFVHLS